MFLFNNLSIILSRRGGKYRHQIRHTAAPKMNPKKPSATAGRLAGSWLASLLFAVACPSLAADPQSLEPFPQAQPGMHRFVITLPHKEREQEERFKVELIAGREMLTDGVNQMRLGSRLQPRNLAGWGYTYYEVLEASEALSTRMAPPPDSTPSKAFVQAPSLLIRYNSRLPVVVYAPVEYQIRYRIWRTEETAASAEKR